MHFLLVEDERHEWSWQLRSGDDIVAVSVVPYPDEAAARRAVESMQRQVGDAQLPDAP